MSRKLEYKEFEDLFKSGRDFSITDTQYSERIGRPLPKDASYIKKRSPLSRIAKENGYSIVVSEELIIQRTLKFIKNSH